MHLNTCICICFQVEWSGQGWVGLCSKCYYAFGDHHDKKSCKGVQKQRNSHILTLEAYKSVLFERSSVQVENQGFRRHSNDMITYSQLKDGLSYIYVKRQVQPNGIDTVPLTI